MTGTFTADDIVFSLAYAPNMQPDRPGICLAACSSGLYRSTTSGTSWVNLYNRLTMRIKLPVTTVAFSPTFWSDHTMFATVAGNVFRSEDVGESWYGVIVADPLPSISCLGISPNYARDNTLIIGTLEHGVYRSSDRGDHWQPASGGLTDRHVLCLALSTDYKNHPAVMVGTDTGVFRSVNGGQSWRKVALPGGDEPVLSLAYAPDFIRDRTIYAGTESGSIYASRDGGHTWTALPGTPASGSVDGLYPMAGSHLAALVDNRLVQTSDAGTWVPWNSERDIDSISAATLVAEPSQILAGGLGGKFTWITRDE